MTMRYGIIGCGSMGREHIENIRALGGAAVTALADPHAPSRDSALAICEGMAPQVFEDHRELLRSGLCDAVVIATPNFTHIEMMRDALKTDLHILVEKPLVTRIEDGLEMMREAEGRQGIVWVAQECRYMPPVFALKRFQSPTLG
jgi:myo-inositol 2-dehydrogenase / D-chiro-inositol 1-dehydrogenase